MKIKRVLLITILLIIAIIALPKNIKASVGDKFIDEGVEYVILTEDSSSGTAQITDYNNTKAKVVIPETITYKGKQYTVTDIGYSAFSGCDVLTNIELPNSIKGIGDNAFGECTSLTSIIIPENITSISYNCFGGCRSLVNVVLPNSLTCIRQSAFSGCSALTSLLIPNLVTSIEYNAFGGCSSLEHIYMPDLLTSIGYNAFGGCNSLTIHGHSNSFAKEYANNNGKTFIELNSTIYKVINSLTNLTSDGIAFTYSSLGNYTAKLKPGFACTLPSSINITMGENSLTEGVDYTYSNGEILITKSVTGDIKISADGVMVKKYVISNLTNAQSDGAQEVYPAEGNYIAKLTANPGYKLPETIIVKVGDTLLDNTKYKYNAKNGDLSIFAKNITDDIYIEVTAIEEIYKVIFYANGGTFEGGSDNLTFEDWKYTDYDNLEKPTRKGYKFLGYYTEKTSGTSLDYIMGESGIDDDMVFYAQWEELELIKPEESEEQNNITETDTSGKQENIQNTNLNNPKTGDNIAIYFITFILSILGIITVFLIKNKK